MIRVENFLKDENPLVRYVNFGIPGPMLFVAP